MSVMPGFGGQKFDAVGAGQGPRPAGRAARTCGSRSTAGSSRDTAELAVAAGVSQMVVGSGVFRPDGNYAAALAELAEGIRRGSERGSAPARPAGPPSHE